MRIPLLVAFALAAGCGGADERATGEADGSAPRHSRRSTARAIVS
jgi:hypothetical protein